MSPQPPRAGQLALQLPHQPARGRADFLVGAANATALALVEAWPNWPNRSVLLIGPPGAGKSHLAAIWHEVSDASMVQGTELAGIDQSAVVAAGALVVEDIDRGIDEPALFHLLNLARERGAAVLMTSRVAPAEMGLALPDLISRLRAAQPVTLSEPDDDLLRQVLVKLFADRQLTADRSLIDHVIRHGERSLAAANALVERLDRASLAERRPIGRSLLQAILAELEEERRTDAND